MKKAFTMIELIFVIVILGILAAVAIPKLMATRTDAKVSAISQEVGSAVQEISNYVTSQGVDANSTELTNMSQVLKTLSDQGKGAENDSSADTPFTKRFDVYGKDSSDVCIKIETNDTAVAVIHGDGTSKICEGVQNLVKEANYTVAGNQVKY
jgi:general secretion pathway protein G